MMTELSLKYIAVTGPTGSGKSALAHKIIHFLGLDHAEIVSCDSVQVYRGFDIGSAKESYKQRCGIEYHLIDCVDPSDEFDASQYAELARQSIDDMNQRGKLAVVVGGTGLYLRALKGEQFHDLPKDDAVRAELNQLSNEALFEKLKSLDPERAGQLHLNDRVRLLRALELVTILGKPISQVFAAKDGKASSQAGFAPQFQVYLNPDRKLLHQRIAKRSKLMLEQGLEQEVQSLLDAGCSKDAKPMQSIGYLQVLKMMAGEIPPKELQDRIIFATRQYAKRQCTWFGKANADFVLSSSDLTEELKAALLALNLASQ